MFNEMIFFHFILFDVDLKNWKKKTLYGNNIHFTITTLEKIIQRTVDHCE